MKKAVVIIPTYNEKENIEKLIGILDDEVFPKITDWDMAILVADDNSPDDTQGVVKKLMEKYKNLELNEGEKEGLGAAYIRAMSYAVEKMNADVMFEMDADFFHDPQKVPEFLKKIDEGFDFVIGTRYSGGGSIPSNWALNRKFLSVVGNLIVRVVFTRFYIHDWTGGYRCIKKEVFLKEKEKLAPFKGYRFQVGFLFSAVKDGFKVAEVPFNATDRTAGRSKMARSETIVDTLMYVFQARFKELERFIKFLIVGGTGFIVQVLSQELAVRIGVAHAISAGIGAETAIIANFLLNNFWTFQDTLKMKEKSNGFIRLVKFNITSVGAIFLQAAAVYLGEKILGVNLHLIFITVPTRIAVLFPTIIFLVIPLNYIIYNKIIWKTQHLKNADTKAA
ncbi:MAG TPA: glycosyltransferase family 2 protein [Candidatus Saccharimonadales bacterium]|nr:glycosyltransferase family 2 protein [Candidatus Saccharimonadales bacterium]